MKAMHRYNANSMRQGAWITEGTPVEAAPASKVGEAPVLQSLDDIRTAGKATWNEAALMCLHTTKDVVVVLTPESAKAQGLRGGTRTGIRLYVLSYHLLCETCFLWEGLFLFINLPFWDGQ